MKQGMQGILLLLVVIFLAGCEGLSSQDISGELRLTPADQGWAYKSVAKVERSFTVSNHQAAVRYRLADLRDYLELKGTAQIGNTQYLFQVNPWGAIYDAQIYRFDGRVVFNEILSSDESGETWNSRVNLQDPDWQEQTMAHKGSCQQQFLEYSTNLPCVVESNYQLSYQVQRKFKEKVIVPQSETGQAKVFAELKVGFKRCLVGQRLVGEKQLQVYLLDYNLDGLFTEADAVYFEHLSEYYPLNQEVALINPLAAIFAGEAGKYRYRLRLKMLDPMNQAYQLLIERVR